MSKDLTYYRLLPYEREWTMREEAGERYFIVRLRDLPAIAGDGSTRDEAVEDLRAAFDEFIGVWLDANQPIPEPKRAFALPDSESLAPLKQWSSGESLDPSNAHAASDWLDNAVIYENLLVQESDQGPSLTEIASVV